MRRHSSILLFLSMLLPFGILRAEEESNLQSETDRVSYSLGRQIGTDLKRQGVGLDSEALKRGFEDAQSGAAPAMSPDAIQSILIDLKKGITGAGMPQEGQSRQDYTANEKLIKGREFLAENAKKPGVKVMPSGLQYREIRPGNGKIPGLHDVVRLHYRARLIDGREFDSSYRGKGPASIQVNQGILGLSEALQLMPVGAQWELYLPPELAFGRRKPLDNETVVYNIELLGIEENAGATDSSPSSETQK